MFIFLHFADVSRAEFNEIQLISDPIKIKQVSWTFPYTVHDPGRFHEVIVPFINLKVFEFNEWNNFLNPQDNIDGFDILSKCRHFKWRLNASLDVKLWKKLISFLPSHWEYDLIFMKSTANSFRKLWQLIIFYISFLIKLFKIKLCDKILLNLNYENFIIN